VRNGRRLRMKNKIKMILISLIKIWLIVTMLVSVNELVDKMIHKKKKNRIMRKE